MPEAGQMGSLLSRCTFPAAGGHLDCAVSGGADSLALLALATEAGCRVTAWHVDHGLRLGSAAEADIVAETASRFDAGFRAVKVELEDGPNLEERARQARRRALPAGAATGHTADDQAETVLINLLRGSGLDGLAGMRPGPQKPLLQLRRAETHKLCAELGLQPVEDPTNADPRFLRNSIRQDLVPLLDRLAGRDIGGLLAGQAAVLREEADLLDRLAADLDPADALGLRAAHPALARRAVRAWLRPHLGGRPPGRTAVERVLAVACGEARATEVGEGVRVERRSGRLSILTE